MSATAVSEAVTNVASKEESGDTATKVRTESKVTLSSFALYRERGRGANAKIEVLGGATDARRTPDGKIQLLLSSVPFHSSSFNKYAPKPGYGMLALYGHRDELDEMRFWRLRARDLDAQFAYVTYDVVVGRVIHNLVGREDLRAHPDAGFLNIRRTKSGVQTDVLHKLASYVINEKQTKMSEVADIAKRPDLFDRFLTEDDDFKQLSVFVIPIADDVDAPGRMRQVAYVRAGAKIVNQSQGGEAELLMPSWMTDERVAKEFRAA